MALKGFKLNFLPKKSSQDFIGVDLNEDHIKLAHLHITSLKREVVHLVSQEVRGMTDDDVTEFVQKTISSLRLKNPRVFLTVPLGVVITRTIEIPSQDPEEIREIVNLQASRHTPYSRAEIIIDMMSLGIVRESYTKVLLVIVPKDAVVRQIQILEKAGLNLEKVFFSPEGICQACSKILAVESSDAVTGIIHMDAGFTTFEVVQRNKILFLRGISIGANQLLDEKEVYVDRFVEELQKSLESYVSDELGPMPSTLLLTGVVSEVTELDDLFNETLHIPLKHQAYFNYFSISSAAKQVAAAAKRVSFFNVIAPLLLYDRMKLDLVSDERKLKIHLEERGRQMVKTGALSLTLLTLVFALLVSKVYFKSAYLHKLMDRYDPVRRDAHALEEAYGKTQAVKDYLATRGESLDTLTELYDTLPLEVKLSEIKYEDGEKFLVKGTSATMGAVFNFVSNLEKSDRFTGVKTKYVNSRNDNGVDVADFEIDALIQHKGAAA